MREVYKKEEEELEKIRNTKYLPEYKPKVRISSKNKKNPTKVLKISQKWKPNLLPRPVWGIIIEFSDAKTLIKIEKLCKMLFLLINPKCSCSDIEGLPDCKSLWRNYKPSFDHQISCFYIRKVIIRENTTEVIKKHLERVKNLSCKKNIHNWELNPQNSSMIRCTSCTLGGKRLDYCAGFCSIHDKMCLNEYNKFCLCRNHLCIACKVPEIFSSVTIISLILSECKKYVLFPKISLWYEEDYFR